MSESDDVAIREQTAEDIADVVELLALTLGAGEAPRTREFWRWKHVDSPFGPSLGLVADAAGTIAGLRAFMRWNWAAGSRRACAVRAVDTATHPDFQRRGIFSRLTRQLVDEARDRGVDFIYNTPNQYSRPGYLKLGWQEIGRVPVLVRPRPRGVAAALSKRRRRPDRAAGTELFRAAGEIPDALFDRLASDLSGTDPRYTTSRSADYLKWRYQRIPGLQYHALWDEGETPALLIFRERERRGFREITIAEVMGESGTAAKLLRRLARQTTSDHLVAVASRGTAERSALIRAGFLLVPGLGPIATVRLLNADSTLPDPLRLDNWRLSLGDIELF